MLVVQHVYSDHVDVLLIAAGATLLFCLTTLRGAGLLRDVEQLATELRGREQEMQRRATTDALTGLANRAVLHERLERDVAAGAAFCVALLDLDDFKHVNDSLGHEAGDELLLQVSARLTRCLHEQDLVVRLGGDEFAVVSASGPEVLGEQLLGCSTGRCRWPARTGSSGRASASRRATVGRPRRRCCCATPTSPCT
jgi:GGDEF domain-containing protein